MQNSERLSTVRQFIQSSHTCLLSTYKMPQVALFSLVCYCKQTPVTRFLGFPYFCGVSEALT